MAVVAGCLKKKILYPGSPSRTTRGRETSTTSLDLSGEDDTKLLHSNLIQDLRLGCSSCSLSELGVEIVFSTSPARSSQCDMQESFFNGMVQYLGTTAMAFDEPGAIKRDHCT